MESADLRDTVRALRADLVEANRQLSEARTERDDWKTKAEKSAEFITTVREELRAVFEKFE